jgi:hypothetical protein
MATNEQVPAATLFCAEAEMVGSADRGHFHIANPKN